MRVPTRLSQLPRFLQQMAQRTFIVRRKMARRPTFRLCYFSCQSYFRYLYCSLHSLTLVARDIRFEVIVFSDTEQPLSTAQIDVLSELIPGIRVIQWPKSMGWGAAQIGSIWKAYALAAEGAADDDVIARVDSDVYFFNDRIFRAVERSSAGLIGDGHFVGFKYCQGGCYFFRARAIRQILAFLAPRSLPDELDAAGINVEDIAAHHFAKSLGQRIWMTWFMMFPDELRNAGGLNRWQRWKFSCLHFVMKNKAAMIESYEHEMLDGDVRVSFLKAIAVE
jgi:hypothetical protein